MTTPPTHPGHWGHPPAGERRGPTVLFFAVPVVLSIVLIVAITFAGLQRRDIDPVAIKAPVAEADWKPYVDAGETVAENLTTIDYRTADRDVRRVLDSSTGLFHADFAKRSRDFVDTVRTSESVSTGTVNGAGIESLDADGARVLVAVTVETVTKDSGGAAPRSWRLRITVVESDSALKASDVEFVS
ncbi:mammalian cell entry protein [Mycolicibacterium arseniciresistens]|uniref:Mammalian cell entry protein n=1 Tax=Mycolicibacterium arseniciresistens TaxID=3062257 RepID=A0ABT8UH50_9MYCO|nr:mammalian cell entry protein [Mycolicibacterium arseniciresistens]MDO3637115.1 mammalian cell entry protein [Mycolicibacterium arseniciresistens]